MQLIWIARLWLHSTFYRFSFCFLSIWPFFRVDAESQLLRLGSGRGRADTFAFLHLRPTWGPSSLQRKSSPCCLPHQASSQCQDWPRDSRFCHCTGVAAEREEMSLSRHKSIACVFILSISFKRKTIWAVSEDEGYKSGCCYLYRARLYSV